MQLILPTTSAMYFCIRLAAALAALTAYTSCTTNLKTGLCPRSCVQASHQSQACKHASVLAIKVRCLLTQAPGLASAAQHGFLELTKLRLPLCTASQSVSQPCTVKQDCPHLLEA